MNECLKNKVEFVKRLSNAIGNDCNGVESLDYVVFAVADHDNWTTEYLVVNYKGGAKQARCCTGNSNAAILEEVAGMVYSSQRNRLGENDTRYYDALLEKTKPTYTGNCPQKILSI